MSVRAHDQKTDIFGLDVVSDNLVRFARPK